jgi:hypothetical protein
MKRIALVLTVALVLAVLGSSVAVADPINSKKAESFDLTCNNGQEFTIVGINGNAGHIVGTSGNIIFTEITITATDPETGEVLYSEAKPVGGGKSLGLNDDRITCTTELGTYFVHYSGKWRPYVAR